MLLNNITELLEQMALEGKRYFTPLYIYKRLNEDISENDLTKLLLSSCCHDIITTNFEVECPDGDTDIIIQDISLIPNEKRNCHLCGIEYFPDPKHIWISFNFKEDYIQQVKKKNYKHLENNTNQSPKEHLLMKV